MNSVRNAIEDYIALRRSLGFKLHGMATSLGKVRIFSVAERSALHHDRTGVGVGDADS